MKPKNNNKPYLSMNNMWKFEKIGATLYGGICSEGGSYITPDKTGHGFIEKYKNCWDKNSGPRLAF